MRFNLDMETTTREQAFLTDLYLSNEWTPRFTDVADKYLDLSDSENLLYINAGTGSHAIALGERWSEKVDIFAACENEDTLSIARDKAAAVSSPVDFSTIRFEDDAFDAVLADGSLAATDDVEAFIEDAVRVARTGGDVAVLLPSAGTFGEVYSLLWEVLAAEDNGEHAAYAEKLISATPTTAVIEAMAARAGMVNIHTETATEVFEYENGEEFVTSPLVETFLLPRWLEVLDEGQQERATAALAALIDAEDRDLTFRFTVKATMLTGEKG